MCYHYYYAYTATAVYSNVVRGIQGYAIVFLNLQTCNTYEYVLCQHVIKKVVPFSVPVFGYYWSGLHIITEQYNIILFYKLTPNRL